jgi:hypothetical protein
VVSCIPFQGSISRKYMLKVQHTFSGLAPLAEYNTNGCIAPLIH